MVGHNPNHDEDVITQGMVRAIKELKEDDPIIQHLIEMRAEIKRRLAIDPTCDPEDELGRYEYIFSRWKPN
jgi:hypothetical protein